jgi:hypothetical protein
MYEFPEGSDMRESRTKGPNKERVESKARSEAERIERLSSALRSVAEIVDAALRDDHRSNYLAKQLAEQLAQVKVEPASDTRTERTNEPRTDGARVSAAVGPGAKVIVTPYVASEMS